MSSIVAIGECGMDGHYPNFGKHVSIQQYLLDQQCQLARHFQLPLVIHSRDGFESTVKVLSAYTDLKIYFHCRWYAMQELEVLLRIFPQLRIGFCWNVTYSTAASLRESLLFLTQHPAFQSEKAHLLLETDAPWLAPQPKRGSTNVPAYISDIYTTATEVTGYTQKKFQELVRDHWFKLYFDET